MRRNAPRPIFTMLAVGLVGLVVTCNALADAAAPRAKMDLAAFGQFPARFNGRMTTLDAIAANYLRRVSGQDTFIDRDGKQQPAVRWLLEVACRPEVAVDIANVPVDPELAKTFGLEVVAGGKDQPARCSIAELIRQRGALQPKAFAASRKPQDQLTDADRAVVTLGWHSQGFQVAGLAFRSTAIAGDRNAGLQTAAELEAAGIPLVIPPVGPKQRWRSVPLALAEALAAGPGDVADHALAKLMARIFVAYAADNADDFNQSVNDYANAVKQLDLPAGAFDYTVPPGWLEIGQAGTGPRHYGDVRTTGHPVAEFEIVENGKRATIHIHHFKSPLEPDGVILNAWRVEQGLAPLPPAKAEAAVGKLRVAKRQCPLFEIRTPSDIGRPVDQLLATIVKPGDAKSHSFEISLYGNPDLVTKHRKAFNAFVRSWQFGSADDLQAWFPLPDAPVGPLPALMLAAVVRDGDSLRTIELIGEPALSAAQQAGFRAFVKSLKWPKDPAERPAWTLPTNWTYLAEQRVIVIAEPDTPLTPVMVQRLVEAEEGSVLQLVNRYRAMFDLPAVTAEKLPDVTETMEVDGRTVTLVSLKSS